MNSAILYYFIVVVLLLLGCFLNKNPLAQFLVIFFILFFVLGGSYFNGADWINYTDVYEMVADYSWLDLMQNPPFEPFFSLLLKIFSSNGLDYSALISVIAVFNLLSLIYVAINVRVKNRAFLFTLIFLIEGWSLFQEQIRQSIAVVLCLLAVYQYFGGNKKTTYVLFFISIGFHTSALLGLLYFYVARKVSNSAGLPLSKYDIAKIPCFFVVLVGTLVLIGKMNLLQSALPQMLGQKIDYYLNDEISSSSLLNLGVLIYPVGFFILIGRRDSVARYKNEWLSFAWSMGLIWCLLGPFLRIAAIFTRFEHFFLMLLPFAFASYEAVNDGGALRLNVRKLIYFLFMLTFAVRLLAQPAQRVWVNDYQNGFAFYLWGVEAEDQKLRKNRICDVLLDFGNDFCRIQN